MYTAKRKLHNLLESITSSSTEPSDLLVGGSQSSTDSKTSQAKRPRLDRPTVARSDVLQRTTSTLSRPNTATEPKGALGFAPWDRTQFLTRLSSFRHVDKWTAKPRPINEVQWAKRGWSCYGRERVKCIGACGKELVIKLSAPDSEDSQAEYIDEGSLLWFVQGLQDRQRACSSIPEPNYRRT
jgi:hypothetical protein